jgi:hypothetical protein
VSNYVKIKFCIRCEDPITIAQPRFFRQVVAFGRVCVEYFCEPCFKLWSPAAHEHLSPKPK